jgi:hypothetical protein
VAALGGLVEIDEVGVDLLGPAAGAWKISPGKTVKPTGSFSSGGFFPDAMRAAMLRPCSQYSRAEEVAVPVSQYRVMLSRTLSRVRPPEGRLSRKAREIFW